MRPRRLELEGFTAFRDRQEIDFTELDLFVITGPTGAGKTSLLDAISLALYGQVPRMGKHNLGQLVTHGKAEARILFEFAVDGKIYRLSRRLPRSGAQQGKLERRQGDEWIDAVDRGGVLALNQSLQQLVRLDFVSFCKAVVLPQGDFATFLKGHPGDRRQTLVALLGLSHYERMGAQARQRANELRIRGEQTRAILEEQFADATTESLEAARTQAAAAATVAERLQQAFARARDVEEERTRATMLAMSARTFADRCTSLSRQLRAEETACRKAEEERREAESGRADMLAVVEQASDVLAAAGAGLCEVTARTGAREDIGRLFDASRRWSELERRVTDATAQLDTARERERALATGLETLGQQAADKESAAATARAAEQDARTKSEQETLEYERETARLQVAAGADEARADAEVRLGGAREELAQSEATAASAQAACGEAERELGQLQREHAVAGLVAGLGPGDPCPVCERPLSEHLAVDPEVEQRLAEAEEQGRMARIEADRANSLRATERAHVASAEEDLENARDTARKALGAAADVAALEALVIQARERADTAAREHEAAKLKSEVADETARSAQLEHAGARERLEGATSERRLRSEALAEATSDRSAVVALLQGRFGPDVPNDAEARLEADRLELEAAEDEVEKARVAETNARNALTQSNELAQSATETIAALDVRLQELRTRADGLVNEASGLSEHAALDQLPVPAKARDERATDLADWCMRATAALDTAREHLDGITTSSAAALVGLAHEHGIEAADADAALSDLGAAERSAGHEQARALEGAARLAERARQRNDLETGIAAASERIAVLDVLATELRGDRFIEFVVQETLDALAVHASDELLRISGGRYRLVSDDGQFSVVDHVNADEQRSVRTLSGGETFMASLSLALALSKHVSDLAAEGLGARLEAVFIDEGFGSLDAETLEEVIDALERLRDEKLLVGVISHVPALAERIRAGLEVQKDGSRSVVVKTV